MTDYKEIATPSRTKEILKKYGFSFKKSLGQNFLTEPNILRKIVETAGINQQTNVVEVGPGIGALTEQLAMNAAQVVAFEIDDRLIPVLADTLSRYDNVTVVHQDVLKADLVETTNQVFQEKYPIKVVANLPYYITTPIMMHFLESSLDVAEMVVMMQKEVADRLAAVPGTKDYGSLSVAVQYEMDAKVAFIVPKTVFIPQPKVDSAIIVLEKKAVQTYRPVDEKFFKQMVKGIFLHRRKSLWNNLQGMYGKTPEIKEKMQAALAKVAIEPGIRAEKLTIAQMVALADALVAEKIVKK